jgi:predicted  nucleic acid-binding Zn-ribbon protein
MTEGVVIKEEIKKLAQLQGLDTEIFDLRSKKEAIPLQVKEMDESLESKQSGAKNAEEELKKIQLTKNEKEMDMQAKEELIKKHESELYQIKNNKEYKALQQEIDSIKADVSLLEEDLINLFDEIEKVQARCEGEKKIFEEEKQNVEKEKQNMKAEEKALAERLNELNAKRGEFVKTIDPGILGQYERILENRGRIALARIDGEFCSECNIHLRPQTLNEVKLKKQVVCCESCARILYAED